MEVLAFTTHSLMWCLGKSVKKFLPILLHFGCWVSVHAYAEQKCLAGAELPGCCLLPSVAPLSVWLVWHHPAYQHLTYSQQVPLDIKVLQNFMLPAGIFGNLSLRYYEGNITHFFFPKDEFNHFLKLFVKQHICFPARFLGNGSKAGE